jgi:uncharacterized protein Smg (DUF494 family)
MDLSQCGAYKRDVYIQLQWLEVFADNSDYVYSLKCNLWQKMDI